MPPRLALPLLLVLESQPALGPLLQEQLAGWRVETARDADEFGATAQAVLFTGEGDPVAGAMDLRQRGMIGPLFALSDDAPPPLIALARPLRLSALIARLETPDGSSVDGAMIGPWRLDLAQRAIVQDDRVERLTDKESSLLFLLLISVPGTVDRERLQTEIWRYHADADTHTVETHVWRLRQKLEVDPANPRYLLTGGEGYYLNRDKEDSSS